MGNQISFENFTPQEKKSKNTNILFVQGKSCPIHLIAVPSAGLVTFTDFYDAATKKSRPPQNGEKARERFVFKAVVVSKDAQGAIVKEVKAVVVGRQVIDQLVSLVKTAQVMAKDVLPLLNISCSGTGTATTYTVTTVKPVSMDTVNAFSDDLSKIDLQGVSDALLGKIVDPGRPGQSGTTSGQTQVTQARASTDDLGF
jgi:hypothetical protein